MRPLYSIISDKTISDMKEVGRNDPCPCGSGKKYKKCCAQKPPMQRRTFRQIESSQSATSIQRVTGVLSQTFRNAPPQAADKLGDVVKKSLDKRVGGPPSPKKEDADPEKEDVDPKS